MSLETTPFRPAHRWLAPALLVLGLVSPAAATAAAWRLEPIAGSEGVQALHDLAFDAQGRGLLSWDAALRGRIPTAFGGLASRDPAGGWQRAPDIAGVQPESARIHLYGAEHAMLIGRESEDGAVAGVARRRLVTADGRSDGGFGPLRTLDDFTIASWSAVNPSGAAVVAWTGERSPFVRVAFRAATRLAFASPRDLAIASSAAVAVNPTGDAMLAFTTGKRLAARVRPAGGVWGATVQFGRFASTRGMRLSALFTRDRRIVVTWSSERRACGVAVRDRRQTWHVQRLERRCGASAVSGRGASVTPLADSSGATYVAWTGRTRQGRSAVKFARIDSTGVHKPAILSRQKGATLDDVAAGPGRALAVTWTAPRPTARKPYVMASFAAVRRSGGSFGTADRLSPASITVARGSRVAFQPLTGEPVVAVPYVVGFTVAVGAAVGQPAAVLPAPAPQP
ncbi:MAG: hypothetical protein QOD83_4430 [Solirubrobacteraceae bacterium]|jgi:hypothetical protein|nr:hypothetical protein [Solirubrobacteraceae bacterium]